MNWFRRMFMQDVPPPEWIEPDPEKVRRQQDFDRKEHLMVDLNTGLRRFELGARRQGKTEKLKTEVKSAIDRGEQIYTTDAPKTGA